MAVVLIFFVAHWQLSVMMQSFFQHRYASHGQFKMSPRAEKGFHLLAFVLQGSSYLNPRAYAYMHRAHHAHSDTEKDPHSPLFFKSPFHMMWKTKSTYAGLTNGTIVPEARFMAPVPTWPALERFAELWPTRLAWGAVYTAFYVAFAPAWMFFLLPVHFILGPVHGAIVNWCGHRYGYRNYNSSDVSRNTLPFDVLCMGELFQNNHHRFGQSPTFATRWFEVDPTYVFIKAMAFLRLIDVSGAQKTQWPDRIKRDADVGVPALAGAAQGDALGDEPTTDAAAA